jgi:hypothetical protein
MSDTPIAPRALAPAVMAQWIDAICDELGWSELRRAEVFSRLRKS